MALEPVTQDARLLDYVSAMAPVDHEALRELAAETSRLEHAGMQSSPEQMRLIALLLKLLRPRRTLEIGCFTGYGTLAIALAAPTAQITTLDVNADWAAIGRRYWQKAGVDKRIRLIEGLAIDSLNRLIDAGERFDFIYVDADKKSYPAYFEATMQLLEKCGLLALDNMLWGGSVTDPSDDSRQAKALRQVAKSVRDDNRLSSCMLPLADGLTLAVKEA